jgi:hypothetical protein
MAVSSKLLILAGLEGEGSYLLWEGRRATQGVVANAY